MAKYPVYTNLMTAEELNSGESYRVSKSYGCFLISPTKLPKGQGTYVYALKRAQGKLYKAYVAKLGEVTPEAIHKACIKLLEKIRVETGESYVRDNLGHEHCGW